MIKSFEKRLGSEIIFKLTEKNYNDLILLEPNLIVLDYNYRKLIMDELSKIKFDHYEFDNNLTDRYIFLGFYDLGRVNVVWYDNNITTTNQIKCFIIDNEPDSDKILNHIPTIKSLIRKEKIKKLWSI